MINLPTASLYINNAGFDKTASQTNALSASEKSAKASGMATPAMKQMLSSSSESLITTPSVATFDGKAQRLDPVEGMPSRTIDIKV